MKKGIGIFLVGLGAMITFATLVTWDKNMGVNIILLILAAMPIGVGVKLLKGKQKAVPRPKEQKKPLPEKEVVAASIEQKPEPEEEKNKYVFYAAGISHYQKEIIAELLGENPMYDWPKRELIEYDMEDEKVYRYEVASYEADLVPEPDNPYDPEAVKIMVNGILVGYVPREKTKTVKGLLNKEGFEVWCEFFGGPYKMLCLEDYNSILDEATFSLKKGNDTVGAQITIEYE